MDPSIVSALVGAIAALATEVAKGTAGEAGKDAWAKIKGLLGGRGERALAEAQTSLSKLLESNPQVAREVLDALQGSQSSNASRLVGHLEADRVVLVNSMSGDIHMGG
jgi:hypothetical protein